MTAIKVMGLTKDYKKVRAVDGVSFDIEEGEIFCLLGLNGAGKTTVIKMLSCILRPTAGDAVILGDSILSRAQDVKSKINVSPQETSVAPNLSVRENLEFIAGIFGCGRVPSRDKAGKMIELFGLQGAERQKAKTLSGGMQRRLSIAMALITDPKILFLDEPTLGVDVLSRRELWGAIRGLKGKVTIILTTHYMEEAAALADKIAVMADGKLKAGGTVADLMRITGTDSLEDAFVKIVGNGGSAA
jgi:ABC-2 type transport system ATP-binding protein